MTELEAAIKAWREVQRSLADDEHFDADIPATGAQLRAVLDAAERLVEEPKLN